MINLLDFCNDLIYNIDIEFNNLFNFNKNYIEVLLLNYYLIKLFASIDFIKLKFY